MSTTVAGLTGESITTAELRSRLGEPGLCVVDARPLPAYNGWRVEGDVRGGHVPGAVAFPAGWLSRFDDAELVVALESKGIATSSEVVVYGGRGAASRFGSRISDHLRMRVRVYDAGFTEWCADPELPVERLANYTQLVHPAWLRELLGGGSPDAA